MHMITIVDITDNLHGLIRSGRDIRAVCQWLPISNYLLGVTEEARGDLTWYLHLMLLSPTPLPSFLCTRTGSVAVSQKFVSLQRV